MRLGNVFLLLGLCVADTGCSTFWENSVRNLVEFNIEKGDSLRVILRDRQLAENAWHAFQERNPEHEFPIDYARGFKAGFIDYLEFGGNGEPPPVPPFRYRLSPYQTPQGYQAILSWYAGFRHGSGEANLSGIRNTIVLPLSSPPINSVGRRQDEKVQPGPDAPSKEPDVLNSPRPLEATRNP
jgi:hypothetical protein